MCHNVLDYIFQHLPTAVCSLSPTIVPTVGPIHFLRVRHFRVRAASMGRFVVSPFVVSLLILTLIHGVVAQYSSVGVLSGAEAGNRLGDALSLDRATGVLAVSNRNDSGSVFVYRGFATLWTLEQVIEPFEEAAKKTFGEGVAVDGDWLMIGAFDSEDTGVVYAYSYDGTGWLFYQKIEPNDGSDGDRFGRKLALEGNILIVASDQDDEDGKNSGSVQLFNNIDGNWTS